MSDAITISDGMVVSIAYTMKVEGEEIEDATVDDPLVYLHGAENIVPGLEDALTGKKVGDKFNIKLQPEDAYGEYDEDEIEEFDLDEFPDDEDIEPGLELYLEDEDGNIIEASIKEIDGDVVVVDLNPPFAGKVVEYDVEVVAIRKADASEIEHGHAHDEDGHAHE